MPFTFSSKSAREAAASDAATHAPSKDRGVVAQAILALPIAEKSRQSEEAKALTKAAEFLEGAVYAIAYMGEPERTAPLAQYVPVLAKIPQEQAEWATWLARAIKDCELAAQAAGEKGARVASKKGNRYLKGSGAGTAVPRWQKAIIAGSLAREMLLALEAQESGERAVV